MNIIILRKNKIFMQKKISLQMRFLHFQKHLEKNHKKLWSEWNEPKKDGLEIKR